MNYQIEFLAPASQELEEAFLWYEQKKENLGVELIEELEYYLQLIYPRITGSKAVFIKNILFKLILIKFF